jgi:hypothetical protein
MGEEGRGGGVCGVVDPPVRVGRVRGRENEEA